MLFNFFPNNKFQSKTILFIYFILIKAPTKLNKLFFNKNKKNGIFLPGQNRVLTMRILHMNLLRTNFTYRFITYAFYYLQLQICM